MSPEEQFQAKIDAEGKIHFEPSFFEDLGETYREAIERDVVKPFEEAIKQLQEPEPLGWYDIRDFLLDKAREDELITDFPGEGDMVQVLEISEGAVVSIKFDSRNSDPFDLSLDGYEEIKHAYTDLYLSNDAQAGGTIKILFARGDWEFKKTVPEIDLQGPIRNDYLEQLTDPLKIGQIIKDSHIVPHANISCEKILIHGNRRLDQIRHPSDYTFIDGRKIYTGSITALQIAALAITTAKLAAGAVTAEKIAALAITAEKIAAKTITADKYKELRNTDSFMDHDSLDPTYPFEMPFQIVSEMTSIVSVKLSFDITNFRAYAKGIPAGGGHTTESGGEKTSGSKEHTHSFNTGTFGLHSHTITIYNYETESADVYYKNNKLMCAGGGFAYTSTHDGHYHYSETGSSGAHTHICPAHDHEVKDHEHTLTFGIYEKAESPTINVYIDNGAGYGGSIGAYTTDQLDIDITAHISGTGHKRVKFTTDKLTRIHAWVMTKLDITA